jgi:PKHD-type hydroxylase
MLSTRPFNAYNVTFPYVYWDDLFTEEELVKIETYLDAQTLEPAKIIGTDDKGETNEVIRITSVALIKFKDEDFWIFDRLFQITELLNSQFYNYDILGFDNIQYTVYDKEGSHYSYHMDMLMDNKPKGSLELPRKLSFSIILSKPEEYEGGELEFMISEGLGLKPEQKRGRVIAFPSFVLHRVTPVITGVRKSLVFWACGPKFK